MSAAYYSTGVEKIKKLRDVALGKVPADSAITGGDIVNVYTGEIEKGMTVLTIGDTIAYAGKKPVSTFPVAHRVINAEGKTLVPGFIDGHTHVDDLYPVAELVSYALKSGTTTIITETSAVGSALGYKGVIAFMKSVRNQPVKFFITLPPVVSTSPSVNKHSVLTPGEMGLLLRRKEVIGLGEISWAQMDDTRPWIYSHIAAAINAGKRVDGHGAGARDEKLQAFISSGVSSDHEPITAGECLERLRQGLLVLIREGAVRKDLRLVSKINTEKLDFRGLAVSADGLDPRQLARQGYVDFIVQKAIDYGFDPVTAIQMVTINIARHFGLSFIGGIAPGKIADIVIIPDLKTIKAERVIASGKEAVENGELVIKPRTFKWPAELYNTIRLPRDFTFEDLTIKSNFRGQVNVRVINQVTDLLTREDTIRMTVTDGQIKANISLDILKVAVIDRYWEPGKFSLGFVKGFGLKNGAIATSTAWDCSHIVVVGCNEVDMAMAVNRIKDMQGGTVVCSSRTILAELTCRWPGYSQMSL